MGMFDYYRPTESLACPVCGGPLREWQGKDGPCASFVWEQGVAAPITQYADDAIRLSEADLAHWRLPHTFSISSDDCRCPYPVEAHGETQEGIWSITRLITGQPIHQYPHETRAEFKARQRWLRGNNNRIPPS
jgi:uncharacterized protein YbaR (Trm112 family)